MAVSADYIIAGGGSAGCVLANRLSENPAHRVVLLEAGPPSDRFFVNMPAGILKLMGNPEVDWVHFTEPDPSLNNRKIMWPSGKMLGGGSALNGMIYIRGARYDYDAWAANGCTGWSWDDVLPYFRRAEDFQGPQSEAHATGGPLSVSPLRIKHPLADRFVEACLQSGLRKVDDYCAGDLDGAFVNLVTQRDGRRCSTAKAYLGAAEGRPNLQVLTGALVDRVLFEGERAIGVRFLHGNAVHEWRAAREVIVSAGSLQSPAVLMRSGIGPGQQLKALGIDVRVDASEVGRNLQEHASIQSSRFVDMPTYNAMLGALHMPGHLLKYLLLKRGVLTMAPVQAMAHVRSNPELPHPDIKLSMIPMCFDPKTRAPHQRPGISINANVSPPKSRGEIRLRSADPADKPLIDHRHLGDPADVAAMIGGLKFIERLFAAPALAAHVTGRNSPVPVPTNDTDWEQYLRSYCSIGFHPVATCRMGNDSRAVVDPTLLVKGVSGLRVIDASIMPIMPTANTNAPAIMIGEKGADLIKRAANTPGP